MSSRDHRPLRGTPQTTALVRRHDNRLGAVLSSLYGFWCARHAALERFGARRDAYSMILFDNRVQTVLLNDTTSTPDELLARALPHTTGYGTRVLDALQAAGTIIEDSWSPDRLALLFPVLCLSLINTRPWNPSEHPF